MRKVVAPHERRKVKPAVTALKRTLDKFYSDFDFEGHIKRDPIEFPHRYKDPEDVEIAGLIASCFAYGRIDLFKPVIERILSRMEAHPFSFIADFAVEKQRSYFTFKYRFNESADILCLMYLIHKLLNRHSSLGGAFRKHFSPEDPDTEKSIGGFIGEMTSIDTSAVYGKDIRPRGLLQFFPSPEKGSACKRMNLFLRWMVRDRDIDFGIWKWIPKDKLIIPLDTHIARVSRCLGFTKRASSDWKAASEITTALKQFDPEDPLRYDFALCHRGISGLCRSGDSKACRECVFSSHS